MIKHIFLIFAFLNVQAKTKKIYIYKKSTQIDFSEQIVKGKINGYPSHYPLKEVLDIEEIEKKLIKIKKDYDESLYEEEYYKIMKELLELKIPKSIVSSSSANSIFFINEKENINLDVLVNIAGGSYEDKKEKYKDSIFLWNEKNLLTKISYPYFLR